MGRIAAALVALACWLVGAAAQETRPRRPPEPAPELDFLEYLGAWAGEDDEWLAIEEFRKDIGADGDDTEESENERDDDDESE